MLKLTLVFLIGGLGMIVLGTYFYKKLKQEEELQKKQKDQQCS